MEISKLVKSIKRNLFSIVGIVLSMALLLFSIWQLDLICVGPVWGTDYWKQPFECWIWKTTIGEAYNTLLFTLFLSFWLLFFSLALWRRRRNNANPVCPKCHGAHLTQQKNKFEFKCPDCKRTFVIHHAMPDGKRVFIEKTEKRVKIRK